MRSEREADAEGTAFRPARWAWTTITAYVLLVLQSLAIVFLAGDFVESEARRLGISPGVARYQPTVLEAFERGFAIALVPVILVAMIVRRLRKKGTEVDERAAAAFGFLAVVVLLLGLACALFHLPEAQEPRLSVETAAWVVGAALLAASVWMRHVPRPWWPRERGQR